MTPSTTIAHPAAGDHDPYYNAYTDLVPDGDVLETLQASLVATRALLDGVPPSRAQHRYAAGKWSLAEVVGHMIDTERVFVHRAFVIARRDPVAPPDMDQDDYSRASNAHGRSLAGLLDELTAVRGATLALFAGFDDEIWSRRGIAAGNPFAMTSFPFIIAGHEIHHRGVIAERYLV